MLDGRVLGASQVEYKPFGNPPLKRECWATRARGSSWSGTAGRTSASSSQRRGSGADEEPLDAAVLDHEPEEAAS